MRSFTNGRGWVAVTTIVLSFLSVLPSVVTGATFASSAVGSGHRATTAGCFSRATVQSGAATSTANGTLTVTISSVDPTTSFLMFTTAHDSNRPVGSTVGGRLASGTTLEFVRATDEASPVPITIDWSVVTYACGVVVQHGSVTQDAATLDVTINAVSSRAAAFVLFSKSPARATPRGATANPPWPI